MYMSDARILHWDPTQPIFHWLAFGFAMGKTQILGLASGVFAFSDTNMLVSPRLKCGVGGVSQRQDPTPMVLRRSGI